MVGDVVARIVRSDGEEMTIGDGDWRIPNDGLENWANLPYSVFSTEIPSSDGAIVTSKRVSAVDRTIIAECLGDDPEALRASAISFFNPEYSYRVYMTYMGRTRWCDGEQIGFKASEGNIYRKPNITWTILCANPFLQSVDDFGEDIAQTTPMFGFPWVSAIPDDANLVNDWSIASAYAFSHTVDVYNDGDVPTGMRITITATGAVKNPFVKLGDGYVKVNTTLGKGDMLELDVTELPPKVRINGQNAMQLVDRNSPILNLRMDVGANTIEYDADDGFQNMSVSVFWNAQYLGI